MGDKADGQPAMRARRSTALRFLLRATLAASVVAASPLVVSKLWDNALPDLGHAACTGRHGPGSDRTLAVLAETHGGYLSDARLTGGDPGDNAASATFIDVEPGTGGVVAFLGSAESTVFVFRGATDRIDAVVVATPVGQTDRDGVVGIPADRVSHVAAEDCLALAVPGMAGSPFAMDGIEARLGWRPASTLSAGTVGQVSVPSGRTTTARELARDGDEYPDGKTGIDPSAVVALATVFREEPLAGLAGMVDLERKGILTTAATPVGTAFDVGRPVALPPWRGDLGRRLATSYVRAVDGVTVPTSWPTSGACVTSADGGRVLFGIKACIEGGWSASVAMAKDVTARGTAANPGCRLPGAPRDDTVVALVADPQFVTGYALGDYTMPTLAGRIVVEPGSAPLAIYVDQAATDRRVVWSVEGDIGRVERFVAVTGENRGAGPSLAVVGLPDDRVATVQSAACPAPAAGMEEDGAGAFAAAVEASLGRPPDRVLAAPALGGVALPSGDRPYDPEPGRARPARHDIRHDFDEVAYASRGYLDIPNGPLAPVGARALPYVVPPGQYGMRWLEDEHAMGTAKLAHGTVPRLDRGIRLPPNMCPGRHAVLVGKSVRVPPPSACFCLYREEGIEQVDDDVGCRILRNDLVR